MTTIDSKPYPWPYHGRFSPGQTALLLFEGDEGFHADASLRERWSQLSAVLSHQGITIVALPADGAKPFPASAIHVTRPCYGAFSGTSLDLTLRSRGLTDLIVAGAPFELGADCTIREANDLGYECLVLEDCCTGLSEITFAGALSSVQLSGGIFGAVATSSDLFAVLKPQYRKG